MMRRGVALAALLVPLAGCYVPPGPGPYGGYPPGYPPPGYPGVPGPDFSYPGFAYYDGSPTFMVGGEIMPLIFFGGAWGYYDRDHYFHRAPDSIGHHLAGRYPGGAGFHPWAGRPGGFAGPGNPGWRPGGYPAAGNPGWRPGGYPAAGNPGWHPGGPGPGNPGWHPGGPGPGNPGWHPTGGPPAGYRPVPQAQRPSIPASRPASGSQGRQRDDHHP